MERKGERENIVQSKKELKELSTYQKIWSLRRSTSSFNISDVVSFTYGPFLSRFWMMRKETLLLPKIKLLNDAPFYAWDCISLSISGKWDIYLIIKNE